MLFNGEVEYVQTKPFVSRPGLTDGQFRTNAFEPEFTNRVALFRVSVFRPGSRAAPTNPICWPRSHGNVTVTARM